MIRALEQKKIPYKSYFYETAEAVSGTEAAAILNKDSARMFKTLVTRSGKNNYYVFMIPVDRELDLKKAAKAVGEKSIEMIKSKELLPLTGYVHGGCSPVGMKKRFVTVIDSSAENFGTVIFSGGRIGCQVEISPADLKKLIPYETAMLCV